MIYAEIYAIEIRAKSIFYKNCGHESIIIIYPQAGCLGTYSFLKVKNRHSRKKNVLRSNFRNRNLSYQIQFWENCCDVRAIVLVWRTRKKCILFNRVRTKELFDRNSVKIIISVFTSFFTFRKQLHRIELCGKTES